MARQVKTPLERLQADIDRCNNRQGCNAYCSQQWQKTCPKLRKHDERIDYYMKNDIPIQYW